MKKYFVLLASEFTLAIQSKLKNYYLNAGYLFIDDTLVTVKHLTRISNGAEYVMLKVAQGTTVPEIRDVIPGFSQGNDPYNRLYNDSPSFQTFLTANFQDVN